MRFNLVNQWLHRASFAVFGPHCVLCGEHGEDCLDLCTACRNDFRINNCCCLQCGLPLKISAPACGICIKKPPAFDAAYMPFVYGYPLDRLIQGFKFRARLDYGRVLAMLLRDYLNTSNVFSKIGMQELYLIPVPIHTTRLAERGFNQALELTRMLLPLSNKSAATKWILKPEFLQRIRHTQAQSGLDASVRKRNVRHAFTASPEVRDKHIVLLDDVVTTCATVRECARVLKRAGALRVDVLALARAPTKT